MSNIRDGGISNKDGDEHTVEDFFEVWTRGYPLELLFPVFDKMRAMLAGFMDFVQHLIDGSLPRHLDQTYSKYNETTQNC